MKTKLKPYTFNTKKWRIENGFTSPEWEMYVNNVIIKTELFIIFSIVIGIVIGIFMGLGL